MDKKYTFVTCAVALLCFAAVTSSRQEPKAAPHYELKLIDAATYAREGSHTSYWFWDDGGEASYNKEVSDSLAAGWEPFAGGKLTTVNNLGLPYVYMRRAK